MKRIRAKTLKWFNDRVGGNTEERRRLRGTYLASKGQVVEVVVSELWSFCTTVQFRQGRRDVIALAEEICKDARQETVGVLIDGEMDYVRERD
jgi:hypothetical protein